MRALILVALAAGACAQNMPGDRVISSDAAVGSIAFSADGTTLAGTCRDGKLRLWDAQSGALKRTLAWDASDKAVFLPTPADLLAAVAGDGAIKLWDPRTGQRIQRPLGPAPGMRQLAFSGDRKLVAAAGPRAEGGSENIVRVWDSSGKERFSRPAGLGGVAAMAFSPDGGTLVVASYDTNVRAWSSRDGELLRLVEELPVSTFALAFSPDGKHLAAAGADRTVYLFETKNWGIERKLAGQPEMISALAYSPDGRRLATGGFSEFTVQNPVKVLLWDVASGEVVRSVTSAHRVDSVAFSPDGALMAASDREKAIQVWSARATSDSRR
jgi:WD40 repeat protein